MVTAVSNTSQTSTPTLSRQVGNLGKEQFLQLLVTQLRNQDPLEPLKDADFIAQMSQFSSLEQLMNMNTNLEQNISSNQSLNDLLSNQLGGLNQQISDNLNLNLLSSQAISNSMATTLLGKRITAEADSVHLNQNGSTELQFRLSDPAAEAKVSVYDEDGQLVRVLYGEDLTAGAHSLHWDGKTDGGSRAPEGEYRFAVEAESTDGSAVTATPLVVGTVSRIQYVNGAAYLVVNGATVMLGNIVEIEG